MEYLMPSDNNIIDLATKAYLTDPVPYPGMLMTEKALIEFAKQIIFFDRERFRTQWNQIEKWRGIALAKDGDGRTVSLVEAEAVEQYVKSIVNDDIDTYMKLYNAPDLKSLILAQAHHIDVLQDRVNAFRSTPTMRPQNPRVG
jgi:hypothetical protein